MSTFFFLAAIACMLGVLGSLLFGIVAMTKGQEKDHKTSNKMMQLRVLMQGLAIGFLILSTLAK